MNCRQALRLLYDVIDREASQIDTEAVEDHLKKCRHCMARYEFERMFQTFVIDKGRDSDKSIQLKQRILTNLDQIDAAGGVGSSRTPFKWPAVAIAAAAALLICVAATVMVSDFYRFQTDIVPFINAHTAGTTTAKTVDTYGTDPFDYLEATSGIRLNSDKFSAESIQSISVDTIKGIRFARLEMLGPKNSTVSVFITEATNYHIPKNKREIINGQEYFVHSCDACNLIGHTVGDLVFLLIAEPCCPTTDLARLAATM